jgi:hypothetical protein
VVQVFVLGGSWSGVKGPKPAEVYDYKANTWTLLPNIKSEVIHTKDPQGAYRADNYGWFFPWSGGSSARPTCMLSMHTVCQFDRHSPPKVGMLACMCVG